MLNISGLKLPMVGNELVGGEVYFADSGSGVANNENDGLHPNNKPLATIDGGVNKCTGSNGDYVLALPGHAETLSAAADIAMDTAGVTVIGLGNMDLRPTLTLGTSTGADVNVSAENCRIKNIKFVSGINSLVNFLDLDAGNFAAEDCLFETSSTYEVVTFVDILTTMDNFKFSGCEFYQPSDPEGTDGAAGTGGIHCVDTENILVEYCRFVGNFETAIIHNHTTKVTRLNVNHCEMTNFRNWPFELVADSEGSAFQCYGETVTAADATDSTIFGIMGTRFWFNDCHFGNDSGGGGQMGVPGTITT